MMLKDYLYEREFRAFSKKRKAKATSTKGVLNHRKTAFFIVSLLFIPVLHWLIFWLFVNFQSIILAFQSPLDGSFTLDNFNQFWEKLTAPVGNILLEEGRINGWGSHEELLKLNGLYRKLHDTQFDLNN